MQIEVIVDNKATRNPIWLDDANGKNLSLNDKPFAERIEGYSD